MQLGNTFSKEDFKYLGWMSQPTERNIKEKNWPAAAKSTDDPLPLKHNIIKANRAITRAQARAMASIQENEEPAPQADDNGDAENEPEEQEEDRDAREVPDPVSDSVEPDDD